MNFLDRILLVLASLCLSSIFVIFFSGELSSTYSSNTSKKVKQDIAKLNQSSKNAVHKDEMIIYSQDIDAVIKQYFHTLKNNPEIDEEEKRVVNDVILNTSTQQEVNTPQNSHQSRDAKEKNFINHVVQKGESLWRISTKYHVPLYTILSANPRKRDQIIHPGDHLTIPTKIGIAYKVKRGDNLSRISKKYKISIKKIRNTNKMNSYILHQGQTIFLPNAKPLPIIRYKYRNQFLWPVKGKITSRYGWRKHPVLRHKHFHQGIDIGAKQGTRIKAVAKGVVIYASKSGGYGRLVILRHKQNYLSAYAHCSKLYVRKGKTVKRGQVIAKVGSSGLATGSHLHFEVKRYQKNVNPILALRKKVKVPII